jgi:hypothetical protein
MVANIILSLLTEAKVGAYKKVCVPCSLDLLLVFSCVIEKWAQRPTGTAAAAAAAATTTTTTTT